MHEAPFSAELRARSCCFTGHRPEKLLLTEEAVRQGLREEIELAIEAGYDRFITGMARGADLWAAQEVMALQAKYPHLQLVAAIPYANFEARWSAPWQKIYREVLTACSEKHVFSQRFSYDSYGKRNRYMVDHANRVIAVYHGAKGGTGNTLDYARRLQRTIRILDAARQEDFLDTI